MSQVPPPPPPEGAPGPAGGAGGAGGAVRPGIVTAAAVLLFVGAGFGVIVGLLLVAGGNVLGGSIGGAATLIGIVFLVLAGLQIYAGVLILQLREVGRIIGIVLAAIGVLGALGQLGGNAGSGVVSLAINGFILYALLTTAAYFKKR